MNAADYGFPQKRRRVFIVGRRDGAGASDPNGSCMRALARALPVERDRGSRPVETFKIEGDPADISELRRAARATPFRNAGYMSPRRVWTLDLAPAYDGPLRLSGTSSSLTRDVPAATPSPTRRSRVAVPQGREAGAAHRAPDAYLYVEGPDPVPRPHRRPVTHHPHRGGGSTLSLQARDARRRALPPPYTARAGAAERLPGRLDRDGLPDGRRAF